MSADPRQEMAKRSRRAFLWMGVVFAGTYGAWRWLTHSTKRKGLDSPLRAAHELNEGLWSRIYDRNRRAPEFPASLAKMPRRNGMNGLKSELDAQSFRLQLHVRGQIHQFSVEEVTALPATEMVTELCCIEGWSQIVKWTGVPLAQFLKAQKIEADSMPAYVSAETPDGKYYVALDKESALHVQTLICWAMDGKPLAPDHGAPLRLVIPPKYGIKSLKRLGVLRLTDERPSDYWYERGYDWYAGL